MRRKSKIYRFIGDTWDLEMDIPQWPRHKVYADTETYLSLPEGLEPWKFIGEPKYISLMAKCEVLPWLLVWTFRTIEKSGQKYTLGDWFTNYTLIAHHCHMEFFENLQSIYMHRRVPLVFFHNASYDLSVLTSFWKKYLDPDIVVYWYVRPESKSFLRGAMHSPKYKFKCEFGDTMMFEGLSVEAIGKSLGKPKGVDVPYTMCDIGFDWPLITYIDLIDGKQKSFDVQKYIEYAERDVDIAREYGESLEAKKKAFYEVSGIKEKLKSKDLEVKGMTQGSLSKSIVDFYIASKGFIGGIDEHFRFEIPSYKEQLYQETIKSNMGGYTTFNKDIRYYKCVMDEKIGVFDCNSEYPFILTQWLPYGELLEQPPIGSHVTWYVVSFRSCEWKPLMSSLKHGPISIDRLNTYLDLRFYMLKEYYEMVDRLCIHESTIHEIRYQKTTAVMAPLIEKLYSMRKGYKMLMNRHQPGDPEYEVLNMRQQGCKIIMNSIYGKLCEKPHSSSCFYYSKTLKYEKYLKDKEDFSYRSILTGSFVSYMGRLMLMDKLERCLSAGYRVLYADTDSVVLIYRESEFDKVSEVFGENRGEMGEWKCEGNFNLFLNSGVRKKYCLLDTDNLANFKIAWSGINKQVPRVFETALKNGNKQALDDLIFIFDPNQNVLFKRQKRVRVLNFYQDHSVILDTDFQMNLRVGRVTAICTVDKYGYVLEKHG